MAGSLTIHGVPLRISALGPLLVETESEELGSADFTGKKPRLLLERLLVGRNTVVHKAVLAEALWPRKAPQNSPATIESYVSLLRKRLFTDRETARRIIITSSDGYRLNTDAIELDLDRFDQLCDTADEMGSGAAGLALRLEAMGLYRGAFLQDTVDVLWLEEFRQTYHDRATLNLMLIAKEQLRSGEYAAALQHAEAAVRFEPYSEESFRLIMLAHYAMGHHSGARQAFLRARTVIGNDLGVDLTSVTEDLFGEIDAGTPVGTLLGTLPDSHRSADLHPGPATVPRIDNRLASRRMPFIGRKEELATLKRLAAEPAGAGLRIALVSGDHGMGKTRLLDELESAVSGRVCRIDFAEADSPRKSRTGVTFLQALADTHGSSGAVHNSGTLTCPETGLREVASYLRRTGRRTLLVDNLDLADEADVSAVAWLRDSAPDVPLSIVATVGRTPRMLNTAATSLETDLRLELEPLSLTEVASYGARAREIQQLCKGIPLFMADMWRWSAAGLEGPPESLMTFITTRLRALNEPIVDALSILGQLCTPAQRNALTSEFRFSVDAVTEGLDKLTSESQTDGPDANQPGPIAISNAADLDLVAKAEVACDPKNIPIDQLLRGGTR